MNSPASAPSAPGPFAVCTHTFEARDPARIPLTKFPNAGELGLCLLGLGVALVLVATQQRRRVDTRCPA
jgi:hypothetical protein